LRRISTLKELTNSYAAMPTAFVDFYLAPFVVDILTAAEINGHPTAPQCSRQQFVSGSIGVSLLRGSSLFLG
jgi:hypothetical protein